MIAAYTNLADNAAVITDNSEAFSILNIIDSRLSKKYRSVGCSAEWIKWDLGSAKACNAVIISGHNLTSSATITIQANSADSWGTPAYSATVTYGALHAYLWFVSTQTYRYWRLTLADSGNPAGYIEIGRVFLGLTVSMPSVERAASLPRDSSAIVTISKSGQAFSDPGVVIRHFGIAFPNLSSDDRITLNNLFTFAATMAPFWAAIWESDIASEDILYCIFEKPTMSMDLLPETGQVYKSAMTLLEVK